MTVAAWAPSRLDRLRAWMSEHGVDCTVVVGTLGVNHLCGYWRYFGAPPALLVSRDDSPTLVVSLNEAESARERGVAQELRSYGTRGFGFVPDPTSLLAEAVREAPELARARRIAIASELPAFERLLMRGSRAEAISAEGCLEAIRFVKDPDELVRIGAAYELCWVAQRRVREAAREGVSEIELFTHGFVAAQLQAEQPIMFTGDLLAGERSAEVAAPVRVAGPQRVAAGEAVISDLVVGLQGYWGDSADTVVIGEGEAVEVREGLLGILATSSRELRPGRTGSAVFGLVREAILDLFPEGEFPHHAGHGVGLRPLDEPHLIGAGEVPLESGMVVALEPGVYFPGRFGVRVERLFVVTGGGGVELREFLAGAPT